VDFSDQKHFTYRKKQAIAVAVVKHGSMHSSKIIIHTTRYFLDFQEGLTAWVILCVWGAKLG